MWSSKEKSSGLAGRGLEGGSALNSQLRPSPSCFQLHSDLAEPRECEGCLLQGRCLPPGFPFWAQ